MTGQTTAQTPEIVTVHPGGGTSRILLVCEHAASFIPPDLKDLGLSHEDRFSHAAWDPGALAVARKMATTLKATLVASGVSRLVYDCNRPPDAPDAMPAQSERIAVPGNAGLSPDQKADRVRRYYDPFHAALAREVAARPAPVLVTVHSFTPVYDGRPRTVEIGVLHDSDPRLADALLACAPRHTPRMVLRNAPYGPQDRVTHTLREHALGPGHLNVMLEIRNDLIAEPGQQDAMAAMLSGWLIDALSHLRSGRDA